MSASVRAFRPLLGLAFILAIGTVTARPANLAPQSFAKTASKASFPSDAVGPDGEPISEAAPRGKQNGQQLMQRGMGLAGRGGASSWLRSIAMFMALVCFMMGARSVSAGAPPTSRSTPPKHAAGISGVGAFGLQRSFAISKTASAPKNADAGAVADSDDITLEDVSVLGLQRSATLRKRGTSNLLEDDALTEQDDSAKSSPEKTNHVGSPRSNPPDGGVSLAEGSILGLQRSSTVSKGPTVLLEEEDDEEVPKDAASQLVEEEDDISAGSLLGLQRSFEVVGQSIMSEDAHAADAPEAQSPRSPRDDGALGSALGLQQNLIVYYKQGLVSEDSSDGVAQPEKDTPGLRGAATQASREKLTFV